MVGHGLVYGCLICWNVRSAYSASSSLPAYMWHLVSSLILVFIYAIIVPKRVNEQRTAHEVVQLTLWGHLLYIYYWYCFISRCIFWIEVWYLIPNNPLSMCIHPFWHDPASNSQGWLRMWTHLTVSCYIQHALHVAIPEQLPLSRVVFKV